MVYAFAGCELDPDRRELYREGEPVEIEPKVFDLLLHLLRHRDRVVGKDELLAAVWPGVVVVEGALSRALSLARSAVGDRGGADARVIRTLRGAGYRLVAEVAEVSHAVPRGDAFVGRAGVIETLDGCFSRARAGEGGVALLAGEPGIGKTRSAEELCRQVRAGSGRVLVARAYEAEASPPYWMWVQLLRGFAREAGAEALLGLDGADSLLSLVPELAPAPRVRSLPDRGAARFALYDALTRFLVSASRERPLLVLLDDLHWADRSSLRVLAIAAPELASSRTLVVGTYRDEEVSQGHPLGPVLAAAARLPGHQHLRLSGLSLAEVGTFVEQALGAAPSARLLRTLFDRSAGNPLFLRQLVQLLRERAGDGDGAPERTGIESSLPPELRAVILGRVERLDPRCRDLLAHAAVVGGDFELSVLADLADLDAVTALTRLDDAVARGLVRETRPGHYQFSHQLIQEALRESLTRARLLELHRAAADVLTASKADPDDVAARVAHHHYEAARAGGDARAALRWARRAGEIAAARLAHDEAAAHFARALEALELERRGVVVEECELLIARGESLSLVGDIAAARALFLRAAEIARSLSVSGHLARAVLGLGRSLPYEVGERDAEQIAWVEEALARVGEGERALRAELLARLAFLVYWTDEPGRCLGFAEEAVRLARESGDARALALAQAAHFMATERLGRGDPRSLADELIATSARAGVAEVLDFAFTARILARFRIGDARGAREDLEAQRVHAERARHAMMMSHNATLRGMHALFRGRAHEAEALAFEALRLGERYEETNVRQAFGSLLLAVRLEQGRGGELEPAVRGLLASWPEMAIWHVLVGWLLVAKGERDEARELLRRVAADDFAMVVDDHLWTATVTTAALVIGEVGDARIARSLHAKLSPFEGLVATGPLGALGPFDWFLGRLARVFRDIGAAEAHLAAAIELGDTMGSPLYAGRARCELARALLDAGAPDAGTRARALVGETLAALAPCDLPALDAEARALRARLDTPPAGARVRKP
jgi:DNA-binding winged helix-turn-helix (wHTH) protein/tetratricopeptide (TPR) repeat protein